MAFVSPSTAMLPTRHLLNFLLTIYVLILIPGPSVMFGMSRARRPGGADSVLGNAGGLVLQLVLVVIRRMARSWPARTLFYRGETPSARPPGVPGRAQHPPASASRSRRRSRSWVWVRPSRFPDRAGGLLRASDQPQKGVLNLTAILPQFIDRSQGHVSLQLAFLGAICVVIGFLSDGAWALAGRLGAPVVRTLAASPGADDRRRQRDADRPRVRLAVASRRG